MERRTLLKLGLAAFLIVAFAAPSFAERACPAIGSPRPGGSPLPATKKELNQLKNRTEFPSSVQQMKIGDILAFDDQRDPELEKQGVALEGYLLGFKREGAESPNCYSDTRRDFHMWVGARRPTSPDRGTSMRAHSVVVEPTPAMQELNPTWTSGNFRDLVGKRIRVTGWLMFDPEHPNQLDKTRGTLWEVHPVMKIEVFQGGAWVDF